MEILTSALSVFLNWELYVLCAISMLIYMPISIWYLSKEKTTAISLFGGPFVGIFFQAIATIFLFVSILIVITEEGISFYWVLRGSFEIVFFGNDYGPFSALITLAVVSLLLMFFSDNEIDFLIGIFLYSWVYYGNLLPLIPDIVTILLIIVAALINLYISPIAILPINKLLGNGELGQFYHLNTYETICINYIQTIVGLLPSMIYLIWLIS